MTTQTTGAAELPEALRSIQRYKIGYATDDWGMSSSTPGAIRDASGAWVRYSDHAAQVEALSAAQAGVPAELAEAIKHAIEIMNVESQMRDDLKEQRRMGRSINILTSMLAEAPQPSPPPAITSETGNSASAQGASITAESAQPSPSPAPAQPGQEGERGYPPLPGPRPIPGFYDLVARAGLRYTAQDLLDYVDADRAARAAPQPATADAVRSSGFDAADMATASAEGFRAGQNYAKQGSA